MTNGHPSGGQGAPTLRQRKQAETAQAIERNAVALVIEHGFDNVTVDMICSASGVSQRTFFNYFKTKDAAILGAAPPRLDERHVREFLASDGADLLGEILGLLATLVPVDPADRALARERVRIITANPTLLHREMERLLEVRAEVEEILHLRLRRSAPAEEPEDDTRSQAALLSHLLAGVFRFGMEQARTPDQPLDIPQLKAVMAAALSRLTPPTEERGGQLAR